MNQGQVNWEAEAKELSYQVLSLQRTLSQVEQNFGVIQKSILDKCSTDDTQKEIDSLEKLNDFIKNELVLKSGKSSGNVTTEDE